MTRKTPMWRKKGMAVIVPAVVVLSTALQVPAGAMAVSALRSGGAAPAAAPGEQAVAAPTTPTHRFHRRPSRTPTSTPSESADPNTEPTDPAATESPAEPPADPGATTPPAAPPATTPPAAPQGPVESDYVDIRQVQPGANVLAPLRTGSRGTFVSPCGRNTNGHYNPDNYIVAPGVRNGAHHQHDYFGNLTTDGFSTDDSLAAGGTTCRNGDRSAYYVPVLRDRNAQDTLESAAESAADGNVGRILVPASVELRFQGNPTGQVTAPPRFIRIITGDAKASVNGGANARAKWTCSGFENRVTTDKYPLCPRTSRLTRVLDFPSCWDGTNTDSANHRTHVLFPDAAGGCPAGTQAIPQLRIVIRYNAPNRALAFALDSFPESTHKPITDHADFENVMSDRLMRTVVNCINSGRRC